MPPTALQRALPNWITTARFALAIAFVAVLSVYEHGESDPVWCYIAAAIFAVAAATDALDGILARRWGVVSVYGRIADPLADKILVLGAFVLLASPSFHDEAGQATGVASWMVVVILARELLVTTLRAVLESRGVDFSAALSGKLKMIVQSVAAPAILVLTGVSATAADPATCPFRPANAAIAWATVLVTIWSAIPYLLRAVGHLRAHAEEHHD